MNNYTDVGVFVSVLFLQPNFKKMSLSKDLDRLKQTVKPNDAMQNKFASQESRLLSFRHSWHRLNPIQPTELALAGFFCLGRHRVQCFSCGVIIKEWKIGDDPVRLHRDASPTCFFVNKEVDNVLNMNIETKRKIVAKVQTSQETDREFFKLEENRLLSFWRCDKDKIIKWKNLAEDGFFLVLPMVVQCFACGGRVTLTEETKAIINHDNLYPDCPFLAHELVGNRRMSSSRKDRIVSFLTKASPVSQRCSEDVTETVVFDENLTIRDKDRC